MAMRIDGWSTELFVRMAVTPFNTMPNADGTNQLKLLWSAAGFRL